MTLYVIPDTNSFLHFKRPDLLDWKAIADTRNVVIVLAAVPIGEIDKHANLHPIPRLRDRARSLKSWIRSLIASGEENPVGVEIRAEEPVGHFAPGLDAGVPDDRLVASALMLAAEGKTVAVLSDDTLMHAKLKGNGVRGLWPPQETRLKDEPSADEAENARLKRELAAHTARAPKLTLEWPDGETVLDLAVGPIAAEELPGIDAVKKRIKPLPDPGPDPEEEPITDLANIALGKPSRQQILTYNEDVQQFYLDYELYLAERKDFRERSALVFPLVLVAHNRGTDVARSFRAEITLPPGIRLLDPEKKIGPKPPAPLPPSTNESRVRQLLKARDFGAMMAPEIRPIFMGNWDDRPYLDLDTNSFVVRRDMLQHHRKFEFDPVYIAISPALVGKGAQLTVRIIAEELLHPVESTLPLRLAP